MGACLASCKAFLAEIWGTSGGNNGGVCCAKPKSLEVCNVHGFSLQVQGQDQGLWRLIHDLDGEPGDDSETVAAEELKAGRDMHQVDEKEVVVPKCMRDELVAAFGADLVQHAEAELGPLDNCIPAASDDDGDWWWCNPCTPPDCYRTLMPMAIGVPGAGHIAHNAAADMTKHMVHFGKWWEEIKNVEALLTDADKMRRVIAVVEHGAHSYALHVFKKRPPKLYEHRWSVLQEFLHISWPQLMILRLVWHSGIFGDKEIASKDTNTRSFSATMFDRTLRNHFFFAYFRMVQLLQDRVQHFPAWCEGCTCHPPGPDRSKQLCEDLNGDGSQCPLQNMRLQELVAAACGCNFLRASAVLSLPCEQMTLQPDAAIVTTAAEWECVARDFAIAMDVLDLVWTIKIGYAKRLPWLLSGLSHHVGHIATTVAKECLQAYDNVSQQDAMESLPDIVHSFLRVSSPSLRADVEKVAKGGHFTSCSSSYIRAIAAMRFANLSERQVEAGHKTIKKEHGYQAFGPVSASVRLRSQVEVDTRLSQNPSMLVELLDCLACIRTGGASGHSMVHAAHLLHQRGEKVQSTYLSKRLAQVLYRCDAVSTFNSFMQAATLHQKRLAHLKGPSHWQRKQDLPLCMQSLAAHHLTDHVRQCSKLQEGCFLSLPAGLSCLCPLDAHSRSIDSPTSTLQDRLRDCLLMWCLGLGRLFQEDRNLLMSHDECLTHI